MMSFLTGLFRKKTGAEHRRYERVDALLNVAYATVSGGEMHTALLNRTKNVSVGGLCAILYEPLERGTGVYMSLSVGDDRIVTVTGTVAWQAPYKEEDGRTRYDTGIRFDPLAKEDRKALTALISRYGKSAHVSA